MLLETRDKGIEVTIKTNEWDLRSIPKGGSFSCSLAANEWEGVTGSYTTQCNACSYDTVITNAVMQHNIQYYTGSYDTASQEIIQHNA